MLTKMFIHRNVVSENNQTDLLKTARMAFLAITRLGRSFYKAWLRSQNSPRRAPVLHPEGHLLPAQHELVVRDDLHYHRHLQRLLSRQCQKVGNKAKVDYFME